MAELDMENRDPTHMNVYVKTQFEDVIAEPDGAHSADCVWRNSYKCFNGGKNCCYTVLTFICALPLALCWGCEFACIQCCHIWSVTPCLRVYQINFRCAQSFWAAFVHCVYDPCYESSALFFSKIHVTNASE